MYEQSKILADTPPTANPRIVEAVDPYFADVNQFFDGVSVGVVYPTAQPKS